MSINRIRGGMGMYVISYDITDDALRRKIAKIMENYGTRVQYSVFECDISTKKYEALYRELLKIMLNDEDGSIRCYNLCANCVGKFAVIGKKKTPYGLVEEEDGIFIV